MGNALGTVPSGPNALPPRADAGSADSDGKRRNFTIKELAEFDGEQNTAIYLALRGNVYDVSEAAEMFGPSGECHAYAGKDISRAIAMGSMESCDIDSLELQDLTDAQLQRLDARIEDEFHKYPDMGRVILHHDLTREALRGFNGMDDLRGTVLLGVDGTIYDVTLNGMEFYGPGGMYEQFAGRDASRALACMSFELECLDDPRLDDLTPEQRGVLNEWTERFQQKYAVVGHVLD